MRDVTLKRGWEEIQKAPSVDEVLAMARKVRAENGMEGPPEFALRSSNHSNTDNCITQLNFMLAFHTVKQPLWLVEFSDSDKKRLDYLAKSRPITDTFTVRTCCGVVQQYRQECLLEDFEVMREAVAWFLKHGTACPSKEWLKYETVVRDVDSTPN